ncbi:MAG TPA: VOC family protein [Fimbriimonas sp.]|nr:VOC family protein [Fimbriimonas sp.]
MSTITPFLWFDHNAEDALKLYSQVFPDFQSDHKPGEPIFVANFSILGQSFTVLNGGPMYKFTEAVSFLIACDTQEEIDHYRSKLSEGGSEQMCGWLKDRFGMSWQVVPRCLGELMGNADESARARVHQAMLASVKFDISRLRAAASGG